jgi:hypothetical protein
MQNSRAVKHSTGSPNWYTPELYMEDVRTVINGIHLDPASDVEANTYVRAKRYFTEDENGIFQDWWADSVYCNPPGREDPKKYEDPLVQEQVRQANQWRGQELWLHKMMTEYDKGHFKQGIMQMFNASPIDTLWWHTAIRTQVVCIKLGRIKFTPPQGIYANTKKNQPTHGNGWIYFGENPARFIEVFRKYGTIFLPHNQVYDGQANLIAHKYNLDPE